jgi:hypothetical protein
MSNEGIAAEETVPAGRGVTAGDGVAPAEA